MVSPSDLIISDTLRLRPIQPEDHARHFRLMRRIYPPAFAYLWPDAGDWYVNQVHRQEALLADLEVPNAPYYHVYCKADLVGIFRLQQEAPCPDFPNVPALKIDRLYLDDTVRGQGIGTTLINYTKGETTRRGKTLLWLERMDTNEATIGFYQKNGFTGGGTFRLTYQKMYPKYRGMQRLWWRS